MLQTIINNWTLIATVLLGVSESLALIPAVAANGIVDAVIKFLRLLVKKPE